MASPSSGPALNIRAAPLLHEQKKRKYFTLNSMTQMKKRAAALTLRDNIYGFWHRQPDAGARPAVSEKQAFTKLTKSQLKKKMVHIFAAGEFDLTFRGCFRKNL